MLPSWTLLPNGDGGENFTAGFSLHRERAENKQDAAKGAERREPGVYRLLRQAEEFRRLLEEAVVESEAALARRVGVSRARVAQVMAVWRLHRPVLEHLRALASSGVKCEVTEHEVRALLGRTEVEQDRWAQERLEGYRAA